MHLCTFLIEMTQMCHQQKRWVFFFSLGPLQDPCAAAVTAVTNLTSVSSSIQIKDMHGLVTLNYFRENQAGASSLYKPQTNKQIIQVMVLDPMLAAGQVVEVAKQFEMKYFLVGVTQPSVVNKQIRREKVTNIMTWHPSTSHCFCQCQCLCLLVSWPTFQKQSMTELGNISSFQFIASIHRYQPSNLQSRTL